MKELIDDFLWEKENKVITRDKHHVPGLANFSHWNYRSAAPSAEPHYHRNIFELHCMVNGCRIFQIESNGTMQPSIVNGNQVAITFPGQLHGYSNEFVEPYEFYSIQIDVSNPDSLLGLNENYSRTMYQNLLNTKKILQECEVQRLWMGNSHIKLLRTAFNFFSDFETTSIQIGSQYLSCFISSLSYLQPVQEDSQIHPHIQRSVEYMQAHFLENPSLQTIADTTGYSLSYFKARFKQEMGTTPLDYLTNLRLEYARTQLTESSRSITQIASDMNYSSSSYFCWAFKKLTSYSPRTYREKYTTKKPAD